MLTRWLELLPDTEFHQGYGMTEAASVLTFLGPDEHRRGGMLGAAGTPVYGVELRITDSLGHPCATGTPGEVCARGGNMMRGYWGKPEETEAAMRDGWYRTGDVGYLDERGLLHLTDRVKDMIVTGGENVYSTEVENVLAMHPAVQGRGRHRHPERRLGRGGARHRRAQGGHARLGEELIEHAKKMLTSASRCPKSVEIRDEPLPLSGAFKPLKRELRRPTGRTTNAA